LEITIAIPTQLNHRRVIPPPLGQPASKSAISAFLIDFVVSQAKIKQKYCFLLFLIENNDFLIF